MLGNVVSGTGSGLGSAVQQATNTAAGAVGSVSPAAGGVVQRAGSGAAQTVTGVTQGLAGATQGLGGGPGAGGGTEGVGGVTQGLGGVVSGLGQPPGSGLAALEGFWSLAREMRFAVERPLDELQADRLSSSSCWIER